MYDFIEGRVNFGDYQTYYKSYEPDREPVGPPLLVLHGGPGSAHNYLLDLSRIVETGREVIFYDQVGSGLSTGPEDMSEYTFGFFIAELNNLRAELGLDEIHVLGHSWGGMLAIEYMLTSPEGIRSLVLASSMISMPLFEKELARLRSKLPKETQKTLKKHEDDNTTDDPEYTAAYLVYHAKHIRRSGDKPPYAQAPVNPLGERIYHLLWGVNEAYPNGTLSSWDRIKDLAKLTLPTLVTSGTHDELTPRQAKLTAATIPNARRLEYGYSAHVPHMEEPSKYVEQLAEFLDSVDQNNK